MVVNLVPNRSQLFVENACQISQIPLQLLTLRGKWLSEHQGNDAESSSSPPPLKKVERLSSLNKQQQVPFCKYHYDSLQWIILHTGFFFFFKIYPTKGHSLQAADLIICSYTVILITFLESVIMEFACPSIFKSKTWTCFLNLKSLLFYSLSWKLKSMKHKATFIDV